MGTFVNAVVPRAALGVSKNVSQFSAFCLSNIEFPAVRFNSQVSRVTTGARTESGSPTPVRAVQVTRVQRNLAGGTNANEGLRTSRFLTIFNNTHVRKYFKTLILK